MYEIHLIIRGCARRRVRRGLVTRNVALVARAPKQRSTAEDRRRRPGPTSELRPFLRTAAGHRLFPILWLTAMTGMRRNEVLGLKWPDIDVTEAAPRPQPRAGRRRLRDPPDPRQDQDARRCIDLDDTTLAVLDGWRAFQTAEFAAVGIDTTTAWVFTDGDGEPVHPHAVYEAFRAHRRQRRRARRSDSTTCATPTGACSSRTASPSRS